MEKELWYKRNRNTNDSEHKIKSHLWRLVNTYLFKTSPNFLSIWRVFLLKLFGAQIGKGCYIAANVTITKPWNFKMGNLSSIDEYTYIIPPIKIGDYVSIGNNVHIIAGGHNVWSRGFEIEHSEIELENGVFIGAGSYIAKGCKIGEMSVVGAHTKIYKSIERNVVVCSYPEKLIKCKRIKESEYEQYRYHYIKQ